MSIAILLSSLDFSKVQKNEFHDWQNREHLPERLRVPGFINGQRWVNVATPTISVNTYDLEGVHVLESQPYLSFARDNISERTKSIIGRCVRLVRLVGLQISPGGAIAPGNADALLFNAMNIPAEHEADFNAWYREEHLPALAGVPGTLCARFFRMTEDQPSHRYLAVYHLTAPEIPDTPAWRKAADTPWSDRVRPHFQNRIRMICRRVSTEANN